MNKKYNGLKVKQREDINSPIFFTFYAKASEIRKWVAVEYTGEKHGASQRVIRESRLNGIKKFLDSSAMNTLPNNLLVAFPPDAAKYEKLEGECANAADNDDIKDLEIGSINFEYEEGSELAKPALLVDGQHRLFGTAGIEEDIPLLVVAMLEASPQEQAFQFIVINNKSVKVPTQTVKSIIADFSQLEESLIDRLLPAGISYGKKSPFLSVVDESERSPFRGLLKWDKNREGIKLIEVTTVESMLSYLNKQLSLRLGGDEDSAEQILFWQWQRIKEIYSEIWDEHNPQFFSKVNMLAMNEYGIDRIRGLASMQMIDIFEEEEIKHTITKTFNNIPQELWKNKWSGIKLQDNKVIREHLTNTFEAVATNCIEERSWSDGLKILGDD